MSYYVQKETKERGEEVILMKLECYEKCVFKNPLYDAGHCTVLLFSHQCVYMSVCHVQCSSLVE